LVPCAGLFALGLSAAVRSAEPAASEPDGAALYQQRCASCHDNPDTSSRAPARALLASRGPDAILAALTDGTMKPMAEGLSPIELDALALHLTGKAPNHDQAPAAADPDLAAACKSGAPPVATGPAWNGWSPTLDNARHVAAPGIAAADVAKL
jgi:polyvinyl alcohol dehydrogenase (cytochrome)